jgi:NhaP-type Na+/H+ or K+/H+ antiporter
MGLSPRVLRVAMAASLLVGLAVWSVVLMRNSGNVFSALRRVWATACNVPLWPALASAVIGLCACALARSLLRDVRAASARHPLRHIVLTLAASLVVAIFTAGLLLSPFAL